MKVDFSFLIKNFDKHLKNQAPSLQKALKKRHSVIDGDRGNRNLYIYQVCIIYNLIFCVRPWQLFNFFFYFAFQTIL